MQWLCVGVRVLRHLQSCWEGEWWQHDGTMELWTFGRKGHGNGRTFGNEVRRPCGAHEGSPREPTSGAVDRLRQARKRSTRPTGTLKSRERDIREVVIVRKVDEITVELVKRYRVVESATRLSAEIAAMRM